MVVLIGQVARDERGRGAFQEVDYGQFFGRIAKAVWELNEPNRTGETLVRAFHLSQFGTPGPVVVALPEDVLALACHGELPLPYPVAKPEHSPRDEDAVMRLLDKSKRPLLIAGGLMRGRRGSAALRNFAEAHNVPVAVTWKNQDVFDNNSPLFAGHLGFGNPAAHRDKLAEADLIIAAGTRLGDIASQNYRLPLAPKPRQPLIHIYPDSKPIGAVFRTELGAVADPAGLLEALASRRSGATDRTAWVQDIASFIRGFTAFTSAEPRDGVDFGTVVAAIAEDAPKDAIITTDAGNMSSWVHRHWKMTPLNLFVGCIGGAMGFGVPAGVASGLVDKHRTTIVVVGDGGMLMTGQELATAMQYGAKPKIVISDNGTYGTIRAHQEMHFPGRVEGTNLKNPDFTLWARSFGAHAVTIARGDDVRAKLREALKHDGAVVIHVKSSAEALSAFTTLSALRRKSAVPQRSGPVS